MRWACQRACARTGSSERRVRLLCGCGGVAPRHVGMGPLGRGLGRAGRHYERVGAGEGTLMRHFLRLALAPGALPGGVPTRSAVALLVAFTGAAQRLAPADLRALPRAVLVAAVAVAADAHLLRAAPATVQPIALLACPHAPRTQHWTTPRIAGIKARRTRASCRASM